MRALAPLAPAGTSLGHTILIAQQAMVEVAPRVIVAAAPPRNTIAAVQEATLGLAPIARATMNLGCIALAAQGRMLELV